METASLARERKLSERHGPWLVLTVLGALATAALAIVVDRGGLAEFEGFSSILRGYTLIGALLGLSSAALCVLTFVYSLRKRALQEHWPVGRGTLAAWLWAHVYFGVLAIVLAIAHAGYGAFSFQLSTGKLLFFTLFVLVASGTVWRAIYSIVPARAAQTIGNYSFQASRDKAVACQVEIEKLAAGRSQTFRQLTDWVLARTPGQAELQHALATLPGEEQGAFGEVATLAATRRESLEREHEQKRVLRKLSGLRIVHVPLSLLLFALLPLHIVYAYDLPAKLVRPGAINGAALGGFQRSEACVDCHGAIYAEWKLSMHAHAMNGPIMIAQTNEVLKRILGSAPAPDPQEICVNCHGPVGAALTRQASLPFTAGAFGDEQLLNEGISCSVCHQFNGKSQTGGGGLVAFQDDLQAGRTYFGPFGDAVGNAFHQSEQGAVFQQPGELCRNCHVVQYDKNGDGRYERGVDLVLQTLYDEWAAIGGGPSCLDCHMPIAARKRAAESASVPFQQDREAPERVVRDHTFVAVDYPLDDPAVRDATRPRREELLKSAVALKIVPDSVVKDAGKLRFNVEVANFGTGHNFPGGFAFVRQAWLEVTVKGAAGQLLASSGVLKSSSDDLCDASIVSDPTSPMKPFITGCAAPDLQLVNFQQMLVDRVEIARDASGAIKKGQRGENLLARATGSQEVVIQHLDSGPVPRPRPSTKQPTGTIAFGSSSTFPYAFDVPSDAKRISVRLLFRTVSPYFLRALGAAQPDVNLPRYIDSIEVTEATRDDRDL